MNHNESNTPRRRAVRRTGAPVRREGEERPTAPVASPRRRPVTSRRVASTPDEQSAMTSRRASPPSPRSRREEENRRPPKPTTGKSDNTALSSLIKAIAYIVVVLVSAGVLSYYGISMGNDLFAFQKGGDLVELTSPEQMTVEQLAAMLKEKNVIQYEELFVLYAKIRSKDQGFIATSQTVSPSMSYDELLYAFKEKPKPSETVRVTIPEGYTVDEIITLFTEEYGIGTREGFEDAIQNYPFDYWFVKELDGAPLRAGRKYRLEGYLYPDTYYFYTTSTEVAVINKFLANFEDKFVDEFVDRARVLGWTVDYIVILASMIQMEAKYESDYGTVSSVFHNRLASNKTQGKLESDATIQYVLEDRTEDLTNEMLNLDSPYNTRLYAGLPPGPITNVTLYAINYALFPADTNYFYFVSRPGGYTLYAQTYAGHEKNILRVEYEKEHGALPDW